MSAKVAERSLEDTIECALLAGGPDACAEEMAISEISDGTSLYGDLPGGYHRRSFEAYDRQLCLIPQDVIDFIIATQPKVWSRLKEHHGAEVREKFLVRLSREIERRGTLDVLRNGVKDSGCRFEMVFFRPASGLNPELERLHAGNIFSVVRQLHYSEKNDNSIDIALFLNGIPIVTIELKNPFTGQNVEHAIVQYKRDRDPREPLLSFRRCLGHFAVDPDLVYVTTKLEGPRTRFLPFNQGKFGGAGNPPVSPTEATYATAYLWDRILARDSVLNLVQHFIQEIDLEDEDGRKTGEKILIFPRYHQLDSVRRLVAHAKEYGTGRRYLIQHSAGSGKSNSIAWLAHQLSILHDAADERVFDSIVVITDRRVLDRQLQRTVRQFEQTWGIVENIDKTSKQLKEALEGGKTIIVTTLQKFPVISEGMGGLPGKTFAVIIDEAHSSQTGESTKSLKSVLAAKSLEDAEQQDRDEAEDLEDLVNEEMARRGPQPNVSMFAFTATPKPKTIELFGSPRPDGRFEPFSLYSMRQAIEEGFILDVLENYTTYTTYWRLLKRIEDDPHYDRRKANYLLRSFVDLHEHTVQKKVEIMVEHFHQNVAHRIDGKAKAMIVTRSRLHAVRYRLTLDRYLKERRYGYRALVAFSGTVDDGGLKYTEAGMNGYPEAQTAKKFERSEYRFLVVANKFQTGFDQPLLHTMYVDKKLGGVNAVQTLSRLNRVYPPAKAETMVLDFANEAEEIQKAFQPFYEKTLLSESTDPNLLYDYQQNLAQFDLYSEGEIEDFAKRWFRPNPKQEELYAVLRPVVERFKETPEDEREEFRGQLTAYVRLYAFLSQLLTFTDADLEKLYAFARLLRRYLPARETDLPREIQQAIDIESYRVQQTHQGSIALERGEVSVDPRDEKPVRDLTDEEKEALSSIIRDLNERFGTEFTEEDRVSIEELEVRLLSDPALAASMRANTPENARLTFDHIVSDRLQDMVDTNFKLYKRVTDDADFSKYFLDWLFERFRRGMEEENE